MATDTAQGVVGGCIYVGKWYFTDNLTQISSHCDEMFLRSLQVANMITLIWLWLIWFGPLDNSSVIL